MKLKNFILEFQDKDEREERRKIPIVLTKYDMTKKNKVISEKDIDKASNLSEAKRKCQKFFKDKGLKDDESVPENYKGKTYYQDDVFNWCTEVDDELHCVSAKVDPEELLDKSNY